MRDINMLSYTTVSFFFRIYLFVIQKTNVQMCSFSFYLSDA